MRDSAGTQLELFSSDAGEIWSYSRFKSLRRCALEYKMRWVDRTGGAFQPMRIDVQAGRVLHQIIGQYYCAGVPTSPLRALLDIYENWLRAYQTRARDAAAMWKEDHRGENRTLMALGRFADSRAARFEPIAREVACEATIGGAVFVGRADLVYRADSCSGRYGILELKLNDVEVRSQEPSERFLQCVIYVMGLPEHYRQLTSHASIYVFDSGQLIETDIDNSLIDKAARIIATNLPRASGPDFPPTLNSFCSSCGFQSLCPAYSNRDVSQ